jgi:hypothetical protein
MSDGERLRRPDLKRTEPIRNAAHYFRGKGSWEAPTGLDGQQAGTRPNDLARDRRGDHPGAAPAGSAATAASDDDPVARAVQLGYHVIEEHIRQGRDTARGLCDSGGAGGASTAELRDFIARAVHLYQDAGSLVADFVDYLASSPALQAALSCGKDGAPRATASDGVPRSAAEHPTAAPAIGVELVTARPARAWTELHPGAPAFTPLVGALCAAGSDAPPITDVAIEPRPGGGLSLRVSIAADQPPGTYSGVIVDAATKVPRGTACVHLPD